VYYRRIPNIVLIIRNRLLPLYSGLYLESYTLEAAGYTRAPLAARVIFAPFPSIALLYYTHERPLIP